MEPRWGRKGGWEVSSRSVCLPKSRRSQKMARKSRCKWKGTEQEAGLVTFALCRVGWWEPSKGSAVAGSKRGQLQNGSEALQVAGRGRGVSSGGREGLDSCGLSRVRVDFQAVPTHVRVGVGERGENQNIEVKAVAGSAGLVTNFTLWGGCLFKENHYVYSKLWAAALRDGIISESWAINQLWGLVTALPLFRRVRGTERRGRRERRGWAQARPVWE